MKKIQWKVLAVAMLAAVALPGGFAWAGNDDDIDTVTVDVLDVLSIEDEVGNFTVTFNETTGTTTGSVSTGQTVGYLVRANSMTNSALAGALSAKMSALIDGITFQANPGMAYVPTAGSSAGNAVLTPVSATAVPISTSATALFNKPASTGNQGKVLNGTAFVNYSGVAARDLSTADGGSFTLTVTLKDV